MIFPQLFCKHRYKTHNKQEFQTETFTRPYVAGPYIPSGVTRDIVKEVLICEKCGKIKQIEY